MYSGVLSLGIGDTVASVIGKRYGRVKWKGKSENFHSQLKLSPISNPTANEWLKRVKRASEMLILLFLVIPGESNLVGLQAWSLFYRLSCCTPPNDS